LFLFVRCIANGLINCLDVCQGVKQEVLEGTDLLDERTNDQSFERLMCEVEFWEVFLSKVLGFLDWLPQGASC
jgi:hypothetical protein